MIALSFENPESFAVIRMYYRAAAPSGQSETAIRKVFCQRDHLSVFEAKEN